MFENLEHFEDVDALGIGPLRAIVDCILLDPDDSKMVSGLANAASGILEDMEKFMERLVKNDAKASCVSK